MLTQDDLLEHSKYGEGGLSAAAGGGCIVEYGTEIGMPNSGTE